MKIFDGYDAYGGDYRSLRDLQLPDQYIVDYKVVPINDTSTAVSVYTMACPEGNDTDQFLIIIDDNKGRVVANDLIGAMKFKFNDMWVNGDILYLEGWKWFANDANCCPSKEGTLEYNLRTGRHKFNLRPARN